MAESSTANIHLFLFAPGLVKQTSRAREDKETKQISLLQGSGVPVEENLHGQRAKATTTAINRIPARR